MKAEGKCLRGTSARCDGSCHLDVKVRRELEGLCRCLCFSFLYRHLQRTLDTRSEHGLPSATIEPLPSCSRHFTILDGVCTRMPDTWRCMYGTLGCSLGKNFWKPCFPPTNPVESEVMLR